jgi:hypothetical protein
MKHLQDTLSGLPAEHRTTIEARTEALRQALIEGEESGEDSPLDMEEIRHEARVCGTIDSPSGFHPRRQSDALVKDQANGISHNPCYHSDPSGLLRRLLVALVLLMPSPLPCCS